MLSGFLFALAAGLMWGLVFVTPLLLPDYPAAMLMAGALDRGGQRQVVEEVADRA